MQRRHTPSRESSNVTPIFGLAAPSATPSATPLRDALDSADWTSNLVTDLCNLVGGIDALERLDAAPLAARALDLSMCSAEDRRLVDEVCRTIAGRRVTSTDVVDDEVWVIITSLLELIVRNDPAALHRGSIVRTAAAIAWLALRGNGMVGRSGVMSAEDLWFEFGVSNCAERGRTLHRATGLAPLPVSSYDRSPGVWLTDASLLHSRTRQRLLERRDSAVAAVISRERARLDRRPIVDQGDGTARVKARAVTPRWAMRTAFTSGRAVVLVTFGETEDDPEVLALSVPDARQLATMIQDALAAPVRSRPG